MSIPTITYSVSSVSPCRPNHGKTCSCIVWRHPNPPRKTVLHWNIHSISIPISARGSHQLHAYKSDTTVSPSFKCRSAQLERYLFFICMSFRGSPTLLQNSQTFLSTCSYPYSMYINPFKLVVNEITAYMFLQLSPVCMYLQYMLCSLCI